MLATIKTSLALKIAAGVAAAAATGAVAQATNAVDLDGLFSGSGRSTVEADTGADVGTTVGVDSDVNLGGDAPATVGGTVDLGVDAG